MATQRFKVRSAPDVGSRTGLGYMVPFRVPCTLVAELLHFNFFWDIMIPYRTESVHFFMLLNLATKCKGSLGFPFKGPYRISYRGSF